MYHGGELEEPEQSRFEERIAASDELRQELRQIRKTEAMLAELPTPKPGIDLIAPALAVARQPRGLVLFLRPALAMAATLIALLSVWLTFQAGDKSSVEPVLASRPETPLFENAEISGRIESARARLAGIRPASGAGREDHDPRRRRARARAALYAHMNHVASARKRLHAIMAPSAAADQAVAPRAGSGFERSHLRRRLGEAEMRARRARQQLQDNMDEIPAVSALRSLPTDCNRQHFAETTSQRCITTTGERG